MASGHGAQRRPERMLRVRRDVDEDLLPAGLWIAAALAKERRVLRDLGRSPRRRIPPLSAMSSGRRWGERYFRPGDYRDLSAAGAGRQSRECVDDRGATGV